MEYLYFVGIVAAVASIFLVLWRFSSLRKTFFGGHDTGLNKERIPPVKKTVCGLSEKEREQIEFQQRIDVWQRDFEARRSQFNHAYTSLQGEKYRYEPPKEKRAVTRPQQPEVSPLTSRFEILN